MTIVSWSASIVAGWMLWTLTEYLVHRFVFHHRGSARLVELAASEHTRHHRDPLATNFVLRVSGHAAVAAAGLPIGLIVWAMTTTAVGVGGWAGWAAGYIAYEVGHWRLHHRGPRTRRGVVARRRHHAHHALDAATNFGVSVPWWDHVFGTDQTPEVVEVPEPHAADWLRTGRYEGLGIRHR